MIFRRIKMKITLANIGIAIISVAATALGATGIVKVVKSATGK